MSVSALPYRLGPALNLCDRPTVTTVCASLVGNITCGGLLAYQSQWQHTNMCLTCLTSTPGRPCPHAREHRWCDNPQPQTCPHGTCTELVTVHPSCAASLGRCCGCCWNTDDDLEGRDLWPTCRR